MPEAEWRIYDDKGLIASGPEDEMRAAFTQDDPMYQDHIGSWHGDLVLVEVKEVRR